MARKCRTLTRGLKRTGNMFDEIRTRDAGTRFGDLRRRLYRSRNGKLLGVLTGIAESMGYGVCKTRWIGIFILMMLSSSVGAHGLRVSLCVAGFFYLLVGMLMQPPRNPADESVFSRMDSDPNFGSRPSAAGRRPAAVPYRQAPRPKVDLFALDRQLDQLNLRIQRMEGIVTDRNYDWDRRMEE